MKLLNLSQLKFVVRLAVLFIFLSGCVEDLQLIEYGKDKCDFCDMTIIDERFASSLLTRNGKTYKFDDLICMMQYAGKVADEGSDFFTSIYNRPYEPMISCDEAFFLKNEIFPSPMGSGYAAFSDDEAVKAISDTIRADILRWSDVRRIEWSEK